MGAVVGSCLSSITLNFMGRRDSIILSGVIFFLSFLLIGLASIPSSVEMILIGRALSGLGVGLAVPSAAIYVAECSSQALRGMLSCMPAFLMAFGVLIGYAFGTFGHMD
jgi:MFS family permease